MVVFVLCMFVVVVVCACFCLFLVVLVCVSCFLYAFVIVFVLFYFEESVLKTSHLSAFAGNFGEKITFLRRF